MLLTAAFILLASAAAEQAPTPSPRFVLDAPDPRAPLADSDFGDWEVPVAKKAAASAPATKPAGVPVNKVLGRQPVVRGGVPSSFGTLDLVQAADVAETWTVTVDGGKVGKLGKAGQLRVAMVAPGKHRLAIFNDRGTLWSGLFEVRGGQTLVLETRLSGLAASDAMAIQSDAELAAERVADSR